MGDKVYIYLIDKKWCLVKNKIWVSTFSSLIFYKQMENHIKIQKGKYTIYLRFIKKKIVNN